jgi:hypothetical protein
MSGASSCFLTTILSVLVLALSGPRVFLFAIFTILKAEREKDRKLFVCYGNGCHSVASVRNNKQSAQRWG